MLIELSDDTTGVSPTGTEGLLPELIERPGTKRVFTEGGLPELTGSAADLDSAREIRSNILMDADDVLSRLRSDEIITDAQANTAIVSPRQVTSEQVHAAEAALNRLRHNADAAFWIGQAGRSAGDILGEMMARPAGEGVRE